MRAPDLPGKVSLLLNSAELLSDTEAPPSKTCISMYSTPSASQQGAYAPKWMCLAIPSVKEPLLCGAGYHGMCLHCEGRDIHNTLLVA